MWQSFKSFKPNPVQELEGVKDSFTFNFMSQEA